MSCTLINYKNTTVCDLLIFPCKVLVYNLQVLMLKSLCTVIKSHLQYVIGENIREGT